MKSPTTPYYLIDESKLKRNLKVIKSVRDICGAKSVLALKCFATWGLFDFMRHYLDGTTSSSLYEARLGYEAFGKEVHAYSVGFSKADIKGIKRFASKVIFNSLSQFERYHEQVGGTQTSSRPGIKLGLRVNPGISYSHYDLADPARRYSRLGVCDLAALERVVQQYAQTAGRKHLSGLMFHFNCENADFEQFATALEQIGQRYAAILKHMEWISLGGGLAFTSNGYPVERFCAKSLQFAKLFGGQIYLEPGEAAITNCAELVTNVVDVVHNERDIVIVDASVEAHMPDHLLYRTSPQLSAPEAGDYPVLIAGRSCLAGDVFGEYKLRECPAIGSEIRFADAAGYTMVQKTWFNGLAMPSIAVRHLDGSLERIRKFTYQDFKRNLS